MFEENLKKIAANFFFAVAILFNLYYLKTTQFEFMVSLFHYRMFNVSALAYTFMRLLYILLPIFLLVPPLLVEKSKRLKYTFYAIGVMYLLGNTWIIYLLADNPSSILSNIDELKNYLQMNALNFDYLVWDSYDLYGILFSTIEAVVYFAIGYQVERNSEKMITFYWIGLALSILLPFVYVFLISGEGVFSSMWLQKNTVIFASGIFMGIGLQLASKSKRLWATMIME